MNILFDAKYKASIEEGMIERVEEGEMLVLAEDQLDAFNLAKKIIEQMYPDVIIESLVVERKRFSHD